MRVAEMPRSRPETRRGNTWSLVICTEGVEIGVGLGLFEDFCFHRV